MAEYIEREAAERILEKVCAPTYAIHALALVKTADVAPVKRGRWKEWAVQWRECSACRYRIQYSYAKDCNFCPNCGADMRGK